MSRPVLISLVTIAVVAFVLVSAVFARLLGASTAERNAVVDVIKAQSQGNEVGVLAKLRACRRQPACAARVRAQVRSLRSPGRVRVLRIDGPSRLAFGARTSTDRIAWKAGERLPVVQCVRLRRTGNLVTGFKIHVASLGAPIAREGSCP